MKIQIYDTTLRDGTQSEGFTLSETINPHAQKLDELGVAFIEGGYLANPAMWSSSSVLEICSGTTPHRSIRFYLSRQGGPEDDANIKRC
jgi:2-isopropylmalate synthase